MAKRNFSKTPATAFEFALHPRSVALLLDKLEEATTDKALAGEPQYVTIDLCNLRNQLAAHLQRVALGE